MVAYQSAVFWTVPDAIKLLMFESHNDKLEAYFLDVLWSGLERLYAEVTALEKEKIDKTGGKIGHFFCSEANDMLIMNDFVWYASSAACFLQLFDHSFGLAGSYREAFPAILKWRDKVSAHPAICVPITKHKEPGKIDSPESQAASIMMHPEWNTDHYSVGGFIIAKPAERSEAEEKPVSSSHSDWSWSLTRIHPEIEAFMKEHL